MKKRIIPFFIFFLISSATLYSQNSTLIDSLSTLQNELEILQEKRTKLSKVLHNLDNKIDSLKFVIANLNIQKFDEKDIVLEIGTDTKLYEYPSTFLDAKAELVKGKKVEFLEIENNNYLKVKFRNKIGYINKYYVKDEKLVEKIYDNAISQGKLIEGTDFAKLSNIIGIKKAKEMLEENPKLAKLILKYGEKYAGRLLNKQIAIGMTEDMVIYVLGYPSDVNKTVTSYGTREQWIYSGYKYLYFKNGRLTSWQNW